MNQSNSFNAADSIAPTTNITGESAPGVSHEQIALRAYEIYARKGCKAGQCATNWHEAEAELRLPTPMSEEAMQEAEISHEPIVAPLLKPLADPRLAQHGGRLSLRDGTTPTPYARRQHRQDAPNRM